MKHPSFRKNISEQALSLYLKYGYVVSPLSIYKDTYKLKPGHYIEFNLNDSCDNNLDKLDIGIYDHVKSSKVTFSSFKKDLDWVSHCDSILQRAFKKRLVSDVPVGVFLSGGIDSSLVASILQKHSSTPLNTFTVGFSDNSYDESVYARKIAAYLGTEHFELMCKPSDAMDIVLQLPVLYDEPFGDSSAIPTYLVSQFASKHVKVALSADGADEFFGGYTNYIKG